MRLVRAAEYAVRAVLYMAGKPFGSVIQKREISQAMDIPSEFLGKIAKQLKRSGIFEIVQGTKGGFRLLKKPEEISLLMVVESVMGEIFLNDCIMRPDACHRQGHCSVHQVWQQARGQLRETLAKATFDKLLWGEVCGVEGR